jgi:NADH-quinone oxidoreductase subunit L
MATVTLFLGFYQEDLATYITSKEFHELHVNYLLPSILATIAILFFIVYKFYKKRPDLRDKLAAQPLMKSIHQVLFNGYFIEAMITWFAKNIVVNSLAKFINWVDKNIIDGFINGFLSTSNKLFLLLGNTHSIKVSNQAGAMMLGALIIIAFIYIGSII